MSLSGSPAGVHAAQLAADHYSSAVEHLRMAGQPQTPGYTGARIAGIMARASVHADLALFCSRAAELGIDLRTKEEREADRKRERMAMGVDCPACGHPNSAHTVYPGGVGPHPEVTAHQYAVCAHCVRGDRSIDPPGPCA